MIRIPQPCSKQWENLLGDDQQKFCLICQKNVINADLLTNNEMNTLPERTCVRISSHRLKKKNNRSSLSIRYKISVIAVFTLIASVFGQENNLKVKGKYLDENGLPIAEALIKLKNSDQNVYTDYEGNFEIVLSQFVLPYTLIYTDNQKKEHEVVLDETKLDQPIELIIKNEDSDYLIGEVIYLKPTFKQRVINTITWPYRKIRKTFFDN